MPDFINWALLHKREQIMSEKRAGNDDRRYNDRRSDDRRMNPVDVVDERRTGDDRRQDERRSSGDRRS